MSLGTIINNFTNSCCKTKLNEQVIIRDNCLDGGRAPCAFPPATRYPTPLPEVTAPRTIHVFVNCIQGFAHTSMLSWYLKKATHQRIILLCNILSLKIRLGVLKAPGSNPATDKNTKACFSYTVPALQVLRPKNFATNLALIRDVSY